ncbi:MAG: hypothetical protein SZ59_C0002G0227 [candidate division TM6 bacterium GW2011_GWF2_28_16]|nr:MAG: hypothetical protein SZ59_C0002G0227 [candidate division TM6 bacterium GW2011_GWF2_28_16]
MKKLFLIMFTILLIAPNCFAGKPDITKISKAEQKFYEDNIWDYLEMILIKNAKERRSFTRDAVNYAKRGMLVIPTLITTYLIQSWSKDNFDLALNHIIYQPFAAVTGIISSYITDKVSKSFLKQRIEKKKLVNLLEDFLKKYDPNMDENSEEVNYKKIIPQELHELFDRLYAKYLKHGKKYLEKHNLKFIDAIKDKIRYEIKKDKYVDTTPTVRVINY